MRFFPTKIAKIFDVNEQDEVVVRLNISYEKEETFERGVLTAF
jgi:hypothetical protein